MSAKQGSGTILDFLKLFRDNHFRDSKNSNLNSGLSDSDTGFVVLSGLGDEDYVITADPSSNKMNVSVGYNANTSPSFGGDFDNGTIFSSDYIDLGSSYDTSMKWWWYEGGDYFWVVGTSNSFKNNEERVLGIGQQIVDRYWPYHETYDVSRVATFLHSDWEDAGASPHDGWGAIEGGGIARVDDGGGDDRIDNPLRYEQAASVLVGTQTTQNDWRATGNTAIIKSDQGPKIIGSIDAWGLDTSRDSETPSHTDTVNAGGRTYQYINPKSGSWDGGDKYFFRVDNA